MIETGWLEFWSFQLFFSVERKESRTEPCQNVLSSSARWAAPFLRPAPPLCPTLLCAPPKHGSPILTVCPLKDQQSRSHLALRQYGRFLGRRMQQCPQQTLAGDARCCLRQLRCHGDALPPLPPCFLLLRARMCVDCDRHLSRLPPIA
jgi:hypothetical protein